MASIPNTRPGAAPLPTLTGQTGEAFGLDRFAEIFATGIAMPAPSAITNAGDAPAEPTNATDTSPVAVVPPGDDVMAQLAALMTAMGQPVPVVVAPAAAPTGTVAEANAPATAVAVAAPAPQIASVDTTMRPSSPVSASGATISAAKAKAALLAARLPASVEQPDEAIARVLAQISTSVEAIIAGAANLTGDQPMDAGAANVSTPVNSAAGVPTPAPNGVASTIMEAPTEQAPTGQAPERRIGQGQMPATVVARAQVTRQATPSPAIIADPLGASAAPQPAPGPIIAAGQPGADTVLQPTPAPAPASATAVAPQGAAADVETAASPQLSPDAMPVKGRFNPRQMMQRAVASITPSRARPTLALDEAVANATRQIDVLARASREVETVVTDAPLVRRPVAEAATTLTPPAESSTVAPGENASAVQPVIMQDVAAITPAHRAVAPAPTPAPLADLIADQQLDLASSNEWLDQLASDLARSAGDTGQMRFRLNPSTLGHMTVELRQTDRGTAIHIAAETEAARAIIADAQPRLLAEARAQGVRVSETQVSLNQQGTTGGGSHPQNQAQTGAPQPILRTASNAADQPTEQDQRPTPRSGRYA